MENVNKIYFLATATRSIDKGHKYNNIHLMFSGFYSDKDYTKRLANYSYTQIIIRILKRIDEYFDMIEHNNSTVEFVCSLPYLFVQEGKIDIILENIIGPNYIIEKDKEDILNNVLFVFEDMTGSNVQFLLKFTNINISGGSITRPHLLSTTQYNLTQFLLKMGYKIGDIYRSSQFSKVESWNTLRNRSYLFDKDLMVTILTREIEKLKVNLNINKNIVEGLIKSNSGNISKLELDLKKSHTEKTKNKINKNIEGLKLII